MDRVRVDDTLDHQDTLLIKFAQGKTDTSPIQNRMCNDARSSDFLLGFVDPYCSQPSSPCSSNSSIESTLKKLTDHLPPEEAAIVKHNYLSSLEFIDPYYSPPSSPRSSSGSKSAPETLIAAHFLEEVAANAKREYTSNMEFVDPYYSQPSSPCSSSSIESTLKKLTDHLPPEEAGVVKHNYLSSLEFIDPYYSPPSSPHSSSGNKSALETMIAHCFEEAATNANSKYTSNMEFLDPYYSPPSCPCSSCSTESTLKKLTDHLTPEEAAIVKHIYLSSLEFDPYYSPSSSPDSSSICKFALETTPTPTPTKQAPKSNTLLAQSCGAPTVSPILTNTNWSPMDVGIAVELPSSIGKVLSRKALMSTVHSQRDLWSYSKEEAAFLSLIYPLSSTCFISKLQHDKQQ